MDNIYGVIYWRGHQGVTQSLLNVIFKLKKSFQKLFWLLWVSLWHWTSLVAVIRLNCPLACGILVP